METRRRTQRVQVASSDQAIGLGVHAPSVVRTQSDAANKAAALSNFLGFGQKLAGQQIERKQELDKTAGAEAAARGDFDEQTLHTMEKSAAFVFGAESVLAKERAVLDKAAAKEFYQTTVDKGLTPAEVDVQMDNWWKERYEGVSTGMARMVLPHMQQARQEILGQHIQMQAAETVNELTAAQGTIIDDALRSGTYNHDDVRAESNRVLGKDATNALLTERWIAYAADAQDETILDSEELAMLRQNREYAPDIQKARSDIKTARIEAAEQATFATQGAMQAAIGKLADNGDPRFWDALDRSVVADKNGVRVVEKDSEVEAYINRFYKAQEKAQVGSVNTNLWATGNGRSMKSNSERDEAANKHANDVVTRAIEQGATEDEAAAIGRASLIDAAVRNNYAPTALRDQIEVSPQNAEAWTAGYDLYTQMRARKASSKVLNQIDSDTVRAYETYERLVRETGNPERARESIASSDFSLWKNVGDSVKTDMENSVVDTLRDGFLFGDNDINDSTRLRTMVKEDLEYYVSKGFPEDEAVKMAVNNLDPERQRYTVVAGELYRSTEGWGTQASEAVKLAKETYAEQNDVRGFFGGIDSDDINVRPVPNKPGYVYIAGPGPLASFGSAEEVSIEQINEGYAAFNEGVARASAEARDEKVVESAMNELYPLPKGHGVGTDVRRSFAKKEQERRWNALTPEQQDALIDRQGN